MPFKKTIVWYLILLPFSYFCFKIHSLYLSSSPVIAYLIGACPLILFIYLPLKNNYQTLTLKIVWIQKTITKKQQRDKNSYPMERM